MPDSRSKCLWTYKIHHQVKYQRLNANALYVAAILFFRSTLHREALPCLPNIGRKYHKSIGRKYHKNRTRLAPVSFVLSGEGVPNCSPL